MTGARTFEVLRATCPVPSSQPGCTSVLELSSGRGERSPESRLTLMLGGYLKLTCGNTSDSAVVSMDFSGTHSGAALPDTSPEALSTSSNLSTLLRDLTRLSRD
ncbi:hypothetical protein [Myxococcus landrumensis]|uniref:Lipoprotein n=1 Tax=Myxococcus landrumensis TaxID=2813577 RepID=A0ABX7MYY4_9BACT|nr:hypothetical protein [Myxococcus landrumus]QSQ11639.1 hypothetical protein JY572_24965 [Myxococcus landrumus]